MAFPWKVLQELAPSSAWAARGTKAREFSPAGRANRHRDGQYRKVPKDVRGQLGLVSAGRGEHDLAPETWGYVHSRIATRNCRLPPPTSTGLQGDARDLLRSSRFSQEEPPLGRHPCKNWDHSFHIPQGVTLPRSRQAPSALRPRSGLEKAAPTKTWHIRQVLCCDTPEPVPTEDRDPKPCSRSVERRNSVDFRRSTTSATVCS